MPRQKRVTPSQERLLETLIYDPDTGLFYRRIDRKRWKAGDQCGTLCKLGYISINLDYVIYRAHRLAWRYMTGDDPINQIDHINGNTSDNRWCNLRLADPSQNGANRTHQKNNKLSMKGVVKHSSGSYVARIQFRKKATYLGVFKTKEEAKAAYDAASKIIHGAFGAA